MEAKKKTKEKIWYGKLCERDEVTRRFITIPKSCLESRCETNSTFSPCNPNEIHSHDLWSYDCSAWNTTQDKGHCGKGGECLGSIHTRKWKDVVDFYNLHKDAKSCTINAQREIWIKPQKWTIDKTTDKRVSIVDESYITGHAQYVTLYIKCDGCECNASNFENWMLYGEPTQKCTDQHGKPQFYKLSIIQ